jgi:TonB family protein
MNSISTSKLPGRTLGNLAIAGSLFLHVGLIAIFSSWQWDNKAPEKAPPKTVTVKFISTPPSPQPSETPSLPKRASIPPVRPMTTQPNAKSRLMPRTPNLSTPTLSPVKMAHQMTRSHSKAIIPSLPQLFSLAKTELILAATPMSTHETGRPNVAPRKFPVLKNRFSNTPAMFSKIALPMKTSKFETPPVHPRPDTLSPLARTTAQITQQYVSPKTYEATFAALPRELPQNPQADRESPNVDLNSLRGLFTGKVRQRIANAKYYPRIARRRGMEGQPIIGFTLDRQGRLTKVDLARTSGYQLLDRAALEAVHQAAPYPKIPASLKMDSFQFKLPISFILK